MLLGIIGLPGGAEWLVILGVILVLFVPSLTFFGLGYVMGRKSAATSAPAGDALATTDAAAPGDALASADAAAPGDALATADAAAPTEPPALGQDAPAGDGDDDA
jgi:hypothetical protein